MDWNGSSRVYLYLLEPISSVFQPHVLHKQAPSLNTVRRNEYESSSSFLPVFTQTCNVCSYLLSCCNAWFYRWFTHGERFERSRQTGRNVVQQYVCQRHGAMFRLRQQLCALVIHTTLSPHTVSAVIACIFVNNTTLKPNTLTKIWEVMTKSYISKHCG